MLLSTSLWAEAFEPSTFEKRGVISHRLGEWKAAESVESKESELAGAEAGNAGALWASCTTGPNHWFPPKAVLLSAVPASGAGHEMNSNSECASEFARLMS